MRGRIHSLSLVGPGLSLLIACTGASAPHPIAGSIQKGPFVVGSDVSIQGLDARLSPTATGYFTQTTSDLGRFSLDVPLAEPFAEVRTTGYYFNEVSGTLSSGPISLRAIVPLAPGANTVQVNLLTTLECDRIATLVRNEGLSFVDARRRAEQEILEVFHVPAPVIGDVSFTSLDMERGDDAAAALVAISAILQGSNSEAELTELVARLSADLAADGVLGPALADRLAQQAAPLDGEAIRANLRGRFAALGRDVALPDVGRFLDSNRSILPPEWRANYGVNYSISISTPTPGARVYYRSEDEQSSPGPWLTGDSWVPFTEPITFSGRGLTLVLSAYAESPYDPTNRSAVVTRTFQTAVPVTPNPIFTPLAGTYGSTREVTLWCWFSDASIYFTTDGSMPTTASALYTGPISISAGPATTVKAFAIAPGASPSALVTSWYQVDPLYDSLPWGGFASLLEARQKLTGNWIGRVDSPWADFNGTIEFRADGTYHVTTLSTPMVQGDSWWLPFLYWGSAPSYANRTWTITDLSGTGRATGYLLLDDHGWRLDMKLVEMTPDANHLKFELWNRTYGPLQYDLTRLQ